VKGLTSVIAAVAAVVGPPLALVTFVGNPLPNRIPGWNEVTDAIAREGISDSVVIGILAVLAWIIWAQIAAAVVVEAVAVVRGVPAIRLPLLPGIQSLAAYWFAAAALIVSPLSVTTGPHAPLPLLVASTAEGQAPASGETPDAPFEAEPWPNQPGTATPAAYMPAAQSTTVHVVQRHDNLWDIAERYVGDPFRWQEIRDLNVGRTQPDGRTLEPGFETILPGWDLLVPAPAGAAQPPAGDYTVKPGDHLWAIAAAQVEATLGRAATDDEVRPYWDELIEGNRDRLIDRNDPSLIRPGQILALPGGPAASAVNESQQVPPPPTQLADPAPEPERPAQPPTTSTSVPTTSETSSNDRVPKSTTDDASADATDRSPIGMLLGIGGAVISTGVLATVRRRQRHRSLSAPHGHSVPPLPVELDDLRTEIALRSDIVATSDVEAALAAVGSHIAAHSTLRARRPILVQLSTERVEVLLDQPALPAPDGWQPEASGAVWSSSRPLPERDEPSPSPALVTVGAEDGIEYMLDLEAFGVLTVGGATDDVRAFARSLLLELKHKASGDEVALAIVGDIDSPAVDGVRLCATWDEIGSDARAWAEQSQRALDANRMPNAFAARGAAKPLDGVAPLVVVCDSVPASPAFDELRDFVRGGCSVCVLVIGSEPRDGPHIHVQDGELRMDAIGLRCRAQGVERDAAAAVEMLLEAADRPAVPSTPFEQPETIDLRDDEYVDPPYDVLVKVLGEVAVVGGHRPLTPKEMALFTYVALHPGCSVDRLEEAIWPTPMESRRRQLHNVVSQVRSALGPDHLPASEDSRYTAGPLVRTDLDLLALRATYAQSQSPSRAIETLRGALELVDGPAFSYRHADRGSYTWVHLNHWSITTESKIVEVAWRLWELCIEERDFDGAIWAARRGLFASPGHAELTEALMRAYVASGDRAAAEDVFVAHAKTLDQLDQDEPAPSTLELWDEIRSSAGEPL